MPYLVCSGRRWRFSSDDIVVPASFFLATHIACLVLVVVALILISVDGVPEEAMGFLQLNISAICITPLMLVQLALLVFYISFEVALLIISCRGSIADYKPRESITNLLIARYGLGVFELIWTILAIIWANFCFEHCKSNIFRGVIIANIFCEAGTCLSLAAFLFLSYDSTGHKWLKLQQEARNAQSQPEREALTRTLSSESKHRHQHHHNTGRESLQIAENDYRETWLKSFNTVFCCFCSRKPRDSNSMMGAVANIFCDEFSYLDLSSTDYVAALTLLHEAQRKLFNANAEKYCSGVQINENVHVLDVKREAAELKYIHTVLRLAMASGGWLAYHAEDSCFSCTWTCSQYNCATCELIHPVDDLDCSESHICPDQIVRNDDSRYLSYASVLQMTNLRPHDIVYCNFRSAIFHTAFIVLVHPELRKVVISVRGTMSLEDVFTDLNAETFVLPLQQRHNDWKGHKGIVQAACYVKTHLLKGKLLERAFQVAQDHYANLGQFDLLLTGHSLGAGTAAILGILLKSDYPSLQVVSFSPPGGLLSLPAAEYSESFIRTIILGKDIIPRMGMRQLENIREDMLNIIEMFHDPKWSFLSSITLSCLCGCSRGRPCEKRVASFVEHIDYSEIKEMRKRPRQSQHALDARPSPPKFEQLYLPGKIYHIVRDKKRKTAKILTGGITRFDYDDVYVSPRMMTDHFSGEMLRVIEKIMKDTPL